ncbi:MAG: hypothetical protein U5L74_00810 [Ideonella sp.]|nr:hypothetical protein [Ideonella sp.]
MLALVYNWWSWYVRLAHPRTRLEAITSRPKLLSAVVKLTSHAGQKKVLSERHARSGRTDQAADRQCPRGFEAMFRATAPQLDKPQCGRAGALHRRENPGLPAQTQPRLDRVPGIGATEEK